MNDNEFSAERQKFRKYRYQAQRMFQIAADSRKRYDWEWLTRDLYRRGYQFSRYNPSNRTVLLSSRSTARIPINLVWAQMRGIQNQTVSFKPKFEVVPKGISTDAKNNARYSNKLLDYFYEKFNFRKKIKETVMQGLMYSVGGPWQIGYDPSGDDGLGDVYIWNIDTFDFYVDPQATWTGDAEFCGKAVRKPLDDIKNNPEYHFYEPLTHGEEKRAASEYKQFLLQALKYQSDYQDNQEGGILYEMWHKVRVNDENEKELKEELEKNKQDTKDLRKGEILMRVVHYLDFVSDPLKVQLIRRTDFPFVLYQADINPVELYGESWAKHVIPMNRALNALESSVFKYNYKYAIGRIVIDKNSGVRIITNEHGDIVEKNQGSQVTSLPLQPLPASYDLQIQNMRKYIEDIGGLHDISFGRIPAGVRSGVGIAELKAADATNNGDFADNLEDFLTQVGKKILKEVALNYDVPKLIQTLGKNGEPDHFVVVGEEAGKGRKNKKEVKIGTDVFDIAMIGKDNQITVKIGSWLAYTKEAQQEKLKEYFNAGIIDQKTFLELSEFSDVSGIIERTRKEELLKKYRGSPAQGEQQVSDEEIAEQENIMIVNEGRVVEPQSTDNHQVHLIMHQDFADNPLVSEHMNKHEQMAKQRTAQPQQSEQPQLPGMMGQVPEEQVLMQSIQELMGGQAGPTAGGQPPPQTPPGAVEGGVNAGQI